ncbi:MAG: YesL family protein [Clostridia bacterium]|nr:YesL family protein [Clostridia bacterium]
MKFITKETKPGPGIPDNAPEKRRFFQFFEILGAKITKLMQLNFIYLLCLIPLIFGLYFSFTLNPEIHDFSDLARVPLLTFAPDYLSLIVLIVSVFITGPATAGFVFVLRNMQRREHTWVFSDFFEHFKKNFAKASLMSAIDLVVYIMLYIAFSFYMFIMPSEVPEMGTMMPAVASGIVACIAIVFTWAHYYIYTIMVTFDLEFKHIIKNSIMFAVGKLPLNLLITLIVGAIVVGMVYIMAYSIAVFSIIFALIAVALIGLIIVFSTYPTIDALMLKRVREKQKGARVLNTRDE